MFVFWGGEAEGGGKEDDGVVVGNGVREGMGRQVVRDDVGERSAGEGRRGGDEGVEEGGIEGKKKEEGMEGEGIERKKDLVEGY